MSATDLRSVTSETSVGRVTMNLEVQIIPVSDVERSKAFYQRLGWRLDDDAAPLDGLRIVQFTPPGSGTSVTFGQGLTSAPPGSAEGGLIVSSIEVAHDELVGRGIDVSEVWHGPPFPVEARQPGPDPERTSYGSFFSFNDPDGTFGWRRRSPPGSPAASTARKWHSAPRRTWRARSGGPRPPTWSTRSARDGHTFYTGRAKMRTGPPGMPPIWRRSRPGLICRPDRFGPYPRLSLVRRPGQLAG